MAFLTKELVGASAKPILLSILAQGETYGYEVMKRVQELSGGDIVWNDGTLYPVLHRLEDEKLITSVWRTSDAGRRRKYYRLTQNGNKALEGEKRQWLCVDAVLANLWGMEPRLT